VSKSKLFTEKPADRLKRLIEKERAGLARAERELLNGSMTFSLQQAHEAKARIVSLRREITRLESVLAKGTHQ